uniref:ADP-ribosyl cyclase/cyclic ADP-ribose hydrolase n=1 Tax=Heterorhabditis bacteriophora TaxID=37862 RepID=A0A1I7XVN6_HETBA
MGTLRLLLLMLILVAVIGTCHEDRFKELKSINPIMRYLAQTRLRKKLPVLEALAAKKQQVDSMKYRNCFFSPVQCQLPVVVKLDPLVSALKPDLQEFLGGHTDVDLWFPFYKYASLLGQFKISTACDLDCYDFDSFLTKPCRWRNEEVSCDGVHDELDFIRMKGSWGLDEGEIIFGKEDRADGFFLIVGSEKKLPPTYSAMLVSDPIQCQEGDGLVKLKHWTSPGVKVRVCISCPEVSERSQYNSTRTV